MGVLPAVEGQWKNERGSIVTLKVDGSRLSGTYRTAVGKPDASDAFDLVGVLEGTLLSFSVAWTGFDSVTAWTGRYDPDTDAIHTLWHLVRSHSDGHDETGRTVSRPVDLWSAFTTQASRFARMPV